MFKGFSRFIAEELGGQMLFGGLGSIFRELWNSSGVKEEVGKKVAHVISDAFHHDWSDEQFVIRAMCNDPVTKADRVKLDRWLAAFKSDDQRNRFRKSVSQFKWEGAPGKDRFHVFDVDETSKVLHAIAEYDDAEWKLFVKNMNLQKPMPAKRFVVMIRKSRSKLEKWLDAQQEAYAKWSDNVAVPALNAATAQLQAATPTGPRVKHKFSWGR